MINSFTSFGTDALQGAACIIVRKLELDEVVGIGEAFKKVGLDYIKVVAVDSREQERTSPLYFDTPVTA